MKQDPLSDNQIREIFKMNTIAVIGMSANSNKPAHYVPMYLKDQGYQIIPVNPNHQEIMGMKCYSNITGVSEQVDIVEIFRPSMEIPQRMKEAIKINPRVIWLQLGLYHPEAEEIAAKENITLVYNRCMYPEHSRLMTG